MIFVLPGVALFSIANAASAQETVYIGGSGQSSVEINLGVLDNRAAPRRASTILNVLQHPGVTQGGLPPVTLRPPPEFPTPAAPAKKLAAKTEVINTSGAPSVKLKAPEQAPTPGPTPALAADKPLKEMTAEEYVAEPKRNSIQLSSTNLNEKAAFTGTSQSKPTTEPKTAAKATNTKITALDPAVAPNAPGDVIQILFPSGASVLPQGAQTSLAAVATRLGQDETLRLQLKAYAGGGVDAASHARRLSLSRALSVRSELIEQGVRSTRIDVRALGNKSESGAIDRVDIILVKR